MEKTAPIDHPISEILAHRWSPRAYDPSRPVASSDLLSMLEAARWAPSCFNEQPWRYLIFDQSDPDGLTRARDCLSGGNAWAKSAPMLLLSVARLTFTHNSKPNRHASHDVGAASLSLALQASALGLWAHQMAGYDVTKARAYFNIPDDCELMAMIAVGYTLPESDLPSDIREKERAPRQRRPVAGFAFRGDWERPLA